MLGEERTRTAGRAHAARLCFAAVSGRVTLAPILVGLLALAALGARLAGARSMLPHQTEPDAVIAWQSSWLDRPDGWSEMTQWAWPAPFYPMLLAATLKVLPGHSFPEVLPPGRPLEEHLAAASEPFVRGRIFIAFLSVLAIPATYLLARRFLARPASVLAAAFAATSLLHGVLGAQARPHCVSASLSLLAMILILRVLRTDGARGILASAGAGLASGVAVGALQNGVFVLPGLVLAHALKRGRGLAGALVALPLAAAVIWPSYLNVIRGARAFASGKEGELELGGQTLKWEFFTGEGFLQMLRAWWSYEPFLLVPAALGLAFLVLRVRRGLAVDTRRELLVAASFPLAFALWWGIQFLVHARFTIPVVPYLAILAAYGLERALRPLTASRPVFAAASMAVLAVPALVGARLAWLRSRPDTYTLAARWIEANADRGKDVIDVGFLTDLPLLGARAGLATVPEWFQSHWQRYQMHLQPDPASRAWDLRTLWRAEDWRDDKRIDAEEIRAMLSADGATLAVAVVPSEPAVGKDLTHAALRAICGEPIAVFHPYDPARTEWFGSGYELGPKPIPKILHASDWGPPIEIFRVPR